MSVIDDVAVAADFERHRDHLQAVARRMLGSTHEAEDAVQEAWLRLSRDNRDGVDNLGSWLTTVVARICLDALRTRAVRREVPSELAPPSMAVTTATPETDALQAEAVGDALTIVLDTLNPAERLAFILHDVFAMPFEEIALIVERSPAAARKLASRARRQVQSGHPDSRAVTAAAHEVVGAFLTAAREGDFEALLRVLDPDVLLRADAVAIGMATQRASAGAPVLSPEARGVDAVTRVFASGARTARPATIDGAPGAVVLHRGQPMVVFDITVRDHRVVAIELVADPAILDSLEIIDDTVTRGRP